MTKIEEVFQNKKALIAYIMAGDPTLQMTKELMIKMEEKGVDLIELGIPFSDPIAEEQVVKEASKRALAQGTTTDKIFHMVRELRERVNVPIVLSTYLNPIFTYGSERFMKNCKECGINGIVVPDLPFEEKGELREVCAQYGISIISMVVPASEERIARIAREAAGFLYCIPPKTQEMVTTMLQVIKESGNIPCAVGMQAATEEQVRRAAGIFGGIVVESAIVELIAKDGLEALESVGEYVYRMKSAVMGVRAESA